MPSVVPSRPCSFSVKELEFKNLATPANTKAATRIIKETAKTRLSYIKTVRINFLV